MLCPPETYRVVTELVGEEGVVEVDGHEGLVVGVVPVDAVVQDGHERGQVGQDLRGPFQNEAHFICHLINNPYILRSSGYKFTFKSS